MFVYLIDLVCILSRLGVPETIFFWVSPEMVWRNIKFDLETIPRTKS